MKAGWSVHVREKGGSLVSLRVNETIEDMLCHPQYSHMLGVSLAIRKPDSRGMPQADEDAILDELEDIFLEQLVNNMLCVFPAVITSSGEREYVFYTYAPEQSLKIISMINQTWSYHELQSTIDEDKQWDVLDALLN